MHRRNLLKASMAIAAYTGLSASGLLAARAWAANGGAADGEAQAFAADEVPDVVEALVATYLDARRDGERFVDTYRRIGAQPFKERVYAAV